MVFVSWHWLLGLRNVQGLVLAVRTLERRQLWFYLRKFLFLLGYWLNWFKQLVYPLIVFFVTRIFEDALLLLLSCVHYPLGKLRIDLQLLRTLEHHLLLLLEELQSLFGIFDDVLASFFVNWPDGREFALIIFPFFSRDWLFDVLLRGRQRMSHMSTDIVNIVETFFESNEF